jgi:hypothetical protein
MRDALVDVRANDAAKAVRSRLPRCAPYDRDQTLLRRNRMSKTTRTIRTIAPTPMYMTFPLVAVNAGAQIHPANRPSHCPRSVCPNQPAHPRLAMTRSEMKELPELHDAGSRRCPGRLLPSRLSGIWASRQSAEPAPADASISAWLAFLRSALVDPDPWRRWLCYLVGGGNGGRFWWHTVPFGGRAPVWK